MAITDEKELLAHYKFALEQIAEEKGPFSRDPEEHARNCIEYMAALAVAALAGEPLPL